MTRHPLSLAVGLALAGLTTVATAASPLDGVDKAWTYKHAASGSFFSEIVSFDSLSKTLWVSGVTGVDVLDAKTGAFKQRIDITPYGASNSVSIHNGIAAVAVENTNNRALPGKVLLFDTITRALADGKNIIEVGSLPDMLAFSADGSRLLVANEGTPNWVNGGINDYGTRIGNTVPRVYGYASPEVQAAKDPVGSVSIIDMATRTVSATATLAGVATSGTHIRTSTGMDFEPEYLAINKAGTRAYVSLQEANAMGVLDIEAGSFVSVIGLGAKNFKDSGNRIDPLNNGISKLELVDVKGLYMPDGVALYETQGKTYVLMANEGDFREDDADRSAAGGLGALTPLNNLRVLNTESSAGTLFATGGRSFSIRDTDGSIVYDSGEILDREAMAMGIYNDSRSRDKGVEPEGIEVMQIGGRSFAFVGLERTAYNNDADKPANYVAAIAIFDITDPANSSFVRMLKTDGDMAPEGLKGYAMDGFNYLAYSSEVSNTTTVYQLAPVPEPATYALMLAGLAGVLALSRRRAGR